MVRIVVARTPATTLLILTATNLSIEGFLPIVILESSSGHTHLGKNIRPDDGLGKIHNHSHLFLRLC